MDKMDKMFWYNFKTEKTEFIDTPLDFANYLPQEPAALSLYKLYIEHKGFSALESACKVLETCCGIKK